MKIKLIKWFLLFNYVINKIQYRNNNKFSVLGNNLNGFILEMSL